MDLPVRLFFAATLLAAAGSLAACGDGEPKADPAALDNHLNQIDVQEEAERRRLIENARARESVRENEMEQNASNYAAEPD